MVLYTITKLHASTPRAIQANMNAPLQHQAVREPCLEVTSDLETVVYEEENHNEEIALRLRCTIISTICFLGVILPMLGMGQCDGWNEGSMEVQSCYVDNFLTRGMPIFVLL